MSLREQIWRSAAYVSARRIGARLTRPVRRAEVALVTRCDLRKPLPEADASVPLQAFVASHDEVLGEVARLKQPPDAGLAEIFARRLDAGFLCFVARLNGRLVAYNWTQYEAGEDDGSFVDLRPGEVHCLDAYTVEDLRGSNIHAALLREMLLFNAGLGYRYAYSKTSLVNRRSPKAHRRLGWELTGRMLRARRAPGSPVVRLTGSPHPWRRLPQQVLQDLPAGVAR